MEASCRCARDQRAGSGPWSCIEPIRLARERMEIWFFVLFDLYPGHHFVFVDGVSITPGKEA
ncbi:MAG: hypothetical protein EA377_12620 [Phycisphaerales bacterium]|nr:MAG: hypothetical protein EA377_12620 [Phycisphaerales bacterium]